MNLDSNNMSSFLAQVADTLGENSLKRKSLENLENLPLSPNECMYLFNFSKNNIIYKKGFQNVLDYHDDEISIDFLNENIHPDDADIVNRVIRAAIIYCLENPNNCSDNLLFIKYRRRKKDGTYINILSQSSIYETDEQDKLSIGLARFTDVSFIDNTENVNWTFNASNLNKEAFKQQIYIAYQKFFTNREIEIIAEIEKGLSNNQISKNLNISESTVKTHRKHIFKKANCHNSEELLLFCKGKGII